MRLFFSTLTCFLCLIAKAYPSAIEPPSPLPVKVQCTFTLISLEAIDTKREQFTARAYFAFQWFDPRLAFKSDSYKPQVFLEDSAKSQLEKMWWPDLEFPNADEIAYNNRGLFIYPDGKVKYVIAIKGIFHTNLNFKNFPFDQQELRILVDSFIWNKNEMIMVPYQDSEELISGIYLPPEKEIIITDIEITVKEINGLGLGQGGGLTDIFSTYVISIFARHGVLFYFFQVFIPIFIIMTFVNLAFFDRDAPLIGRISAANLGFVSLIALKFAIGQDLPPVNYMTILDQIYAIAYIFLGIDVLLKILDYWLKHKKERWSYLLNFHSRWACLLAFLCVCILLVVIKLYT